jgi:hypothetical protein
VTASPRPPTPTPTQPNPLAAPAVQEKEALEAAWSERMASVQDAAARRFDVLQHELELKVGGLTGRLGELAKREARREAKRGEVAQQVRGCTGWVGDGSRGTGVVHQRGGGTAGVYVGGAL